MLCTQDQLQLANQARRACLPRRVCLTDFCKKTDSPSRIWSASFKPAISDSLRAFLSAYGSALATHISFSLSRADWTALSSSDTPERSPDNSPTALSRPAASLVLYLRSCCL